MPGHVNASGHFVNETLSVDEMARNNLPDIAARWEERAGTERERPRTAQSFCVPKSEIAVAGYDLSLNRYKEVVHEAAVNRPGFAGGRLV